MKTVLKWLKWFGMVVGAIVLIIIAFRLYNQWRYPASKSTEVTYYTNPTDLSLYPSEVAGAQVKHIEGDYMNGFHLIPEQKTTKGLIVVFGGSEDSSDFNKAKQLAESGYEVLSLFFFGMPNQQPKLFQVPLEFFEEVLDYIDENQLDASPLTVMGASKGAELALNLVNYYPEIDHLVLQAPSSYNFNGLDFGDSKSSWTYNGEELPYISTAKASPVAFGMLMLQMVTASPMEFEPLYTSAVELDENRDEKLILKEHKDVEILIFAGADDRVWASATMAEIIKEYQKTGISVHIFSGAGHTLRGDGVAVFPQGSMRGGGTFEKNEEAFQQATIILNDTLIRWHGK